MPGMVGTSAETDSGSVRPIEDNERLYRRVLPGWYQPGKTKKIPQRAFMPRPWKSEEDQGDKDGLSVNRASMVEIDRAATMPHNGKKAHLAEFGVEDVKGLNLTVEPKPLRDDPSHAVIPELNSLDRRAPAHEASMEEWAMALRDCATLVYEASVDQ
jgi:hypothetical protein